MAVLFRYFRRVLWLLGGVLLLVALGLGVYSNTEAFRQMVREQLIAAANEAIRGSLLLERIEGSIWGDVTLHDVRLRYRDEDIVRIRQVKLSYALLPLLRGRLQIKRADAVEPKVRLVRDRKGDWNIAEALGSKSESETQSGLTVSLNALSTRGGDVDIRLDGDEPQRYHLKNLTLASRLAVLPKGIDFEAENFTSRLDVAKFPELDLHGRMIYRDTDSTPTIDVHELKINSATSHLKLSGRLVGFDKSRVEALLRVERLAPADIARVIPDWPVQEVITGQMAATGFFDALAVRSDLSAAGAKLKSEFTLNAIAPTPSYQGRIEIAGIDAWSMLGVRDLAGVLDGDAKFQGTGFELNKLGIDGNFAAHSLQVKQWRLGELHLNVELRDGVAALNGDLSSELGRANWRGKVTLSKVPRYDFDLEVDHLDIKKVKADQGIPSGVVSFKGTVQGAGLSPVELKAQTNLEILPSTIGSVELRSGVLNAAYGDGRIRIARAALQSNDSMFVLKGEIGTALDQRGRLDYEVRSENITPWLALIGRKGAGSMTLSGSALGSLTNLMARGVLKAARLQLDNASVGSGAIDFDLARRIGQDIPDGSVVARLANLKVGAELQRLDATIKLLAGNKAQIEARAQDSFSRMHTLKGDVDYSSRDLVAKLQQLSLTLPDGNWNLAQPSRFTKRADSLRIENFKLRNGERQAALDGELALSGAQAVNLTVARLPLETLTAYLPKQPKMTGLIEMKAQIGGTAAAPQINGSLRLTDPTIGGQRYGGMVADVSFRERHANLDLSVQQDASHALRATGQLPLRLSWQDGWHSEVTGDLELRIHSAGLSAAFLNAYTAKTVSNIAGEVSLDVTARGPVMEPRFLGSIRLRGGTLKLTQLNVEMRDIGAAASFDQRRLTIDNFSARSNDGKLTGSGQLALQQYQIEEFKLAVAASHWPAIQTRRYQARIGGQVELTGTLSAPKLAGKVDISDATIRPDLSFLRQSSTPALRDETIVIVNRDGSPRSELTRRNGDNGLGETGLFKKLTLDLEVRLPSDVWIRHPDAAVELKGAVRAKKNSAEKLQLVGMAEVVRGWAGFQGRRFDIVRGEARFVGGDKIDPQLDIVAQHRLPQYTVDAIVGGTAENPSLVLRSDPALDQSDILALLVFGKPTKDLNRGEQAALKQSALDITSGFAAAQIGSAVAEAIGLDALGYDLGDFDFSGGRVGYGRYIEQRTYVTFSQEVAGEQGQKATVEYQISRDWKIESSTTSKGASEVGIIWRRRY